MCARGRHGSACLCCARGTCCLAGKDPSMLAMSLCLHATPRASCLTPPLALGFAPLHNGQRRSLTPTSPHCVPCSAAFRSSPCGPLRAVLSVRSSPCGPLRAAARGVRRHHGQHGDATLIERRSAHGRRGREHVSGGRTRPSRRVLSQGDARVDAHNDEAPLLTWARATRPSAAAPHRKSARFARVSIRPRSTGTAPSAANVRTHARPWPTARSPRP